MTVGSVATAMPPREAYARLAIAYNDTVNPVVALQQRILHPLLPDAETQSVLDLGCGTGYVLDLWREHRPRRLLGLDFSREMLSRAQNAVVELVEADCCSLPIADSSIDVASCCLTVGYLPSLGLFAEEAARVLKPDGLLFVSELHPDTALQFGWKRAFTHSKDSIAIQSRAIPVDEVLATFSAAGFTAELLLEPAFDEPERSLFEAADKLPDFDRFRGVPALYALRLRRTTARESSLSSVAFANGRIALSSLLAVPSHIRVEDDRVTSIGNLDPPSQCTLDLAGYLVLPGLINAHDHLEFALFPRLGRGGYRNSQEWAEEIYRPDQSPIGEHLRVPKWVRLWWGGIRNLLAGVTTVCHHNPYEALFNDDFPVRVLRNYAWAHSLSFERDVAIKHRTSSPNVPFLIHLAEGVDSRSTAEIHVLDAAGALDQRTVVIHGNALTASQLHLLEQRGAGLVWCPSSNHFLFGQSLSSEQVAGLSRRALGSDSPLTAAGDLLDEVRFARDLGASAEFLYELLTTTASRVLRLKRSEGRIDPRGVADFVAVRDPGLSPADTLASVSYREIELVVLAGRIRLVSDELKRRLPTQLTSKLELLVVDGVRRWIAAPVTELLALSRDALGPHITMCGRTLTQ